MGYKEVLFGGQPKYPNILYHISVGKPSFFVGGKCTIPYYHSESFMVSFMERISYLSWDISPGPKNGLRIVAWVRAHSDAVQRASHGHSRPQWARLALLAHVPASELLSRFTSTVVG